MNSERQKMPNSHLDQLTGRQVRARKSEFPSQSIELCPVCGKRSGFYPIVNQVGKIIYRHRVNLPRVPGRSLVKKTVYCERKL